jgi:hypothetical protein
VIVLRAAVLALFLAGTAANGWMYFRHRTHTVEAMQIITSQMRTPQDAEGTARLRGSIIVLGRIDREEMLQSLFLEAFLITIAAIVWVRSAHGRSGPSPTA